MKQFDLFIQPRTRRRNSDPATSHAAAELAAQFSESQMGTILQALRLHGPMTFHQLASWVSIGPEACHRRLPEMERKGLVLATEVTRPGPSGRQCRVWAAV